MKNQLFTLLITALIIFSCQSGQQQEATTDNSGEAPTGANVLTEQEAADGWTLLFDGRTLDQWRGYDRPDLPSAGWIAKDGALVIEKTPSPKPDDFGGDIITKEQFENFELSIDFMVAEKANSGILYLVHEEENSAIWHNAPEFQVIDNAGWAELEPGFETSTHRVGDNYDMEGCAGNYGKPAGEWNTARIIFNKGHVEHWLNGNKCLEYEIGSPKWREQLANSKFREYPMYGMAVTGNIGLQDHGDEVWFRNIKIRRL